MSKSAAEQYQIKKKRKHNKANSNNNSSNNNNNNNNNNYNSSNNINNNNQLISCKRQKRDENYCGSENFFRCRRIRDRATTTTTTTQSTTTTAAATTTIGAMPLSQGYYMKPSKRGLKAALKMAETRRHFGQTELLHNNNNNNNNNSSSNNNSSNSVSNSFELSFLLGESFARQGSLPKAFDVYELIASRQQDGYVPLDQLSVLASALTTHLQQLGGVHRLSRDQALQSTLKARYQSSREQSHSWTSSHSLGLGLGLDLGLNVAPLELHSPTRELRVPSPTLADDYDPLLCPLCCDILRLPVTTNCGHTFCQECCETITMCNICHTKFPRCSATASEPPQMGLGLGLALTTTTMSSSAQSSSRFFTGFSSSNSSHSPSLAGGYNLRLSMTSMPTTVTTTTVASTTATATTTMASTSASAAAALGGLGGLGYVGNMKFMPDVLVRNLVEKWWGAQLQAKKINEMASSCINSNLLDDALKFCNASLEKAPSNFKSLCLRAEVLLKLCHFQSSLADIENALKTRGTSPKAHYLRALALSGLGRLEEALHNGFLAICLDKTTNLSNSEIFQHDLAKILQRLLAQTPKSRAEAETRLPRGYSTKTPYALLWEQLRRRRKQHAALSSGHASLFDVDVDIDIDVEDEFGISCDQHQYENYIMADEESAQLHMDGDFLFPSALDFMDQQSVYELNNAKEFELEARRHATRKHCRRKWPSAQAAQLLPTLAAPAHESRRCSRLFSGVLERTQLELQRLKKLESSQLTAVADQLIDASDFDCVLCCRTLWKPVVTPCGHTYCLVCLDRCMDYNSSCPLCMSPLVELNVNNNLYQGSSSPVPFALAKRPVTKFLEAAMKRFIPDHYEARFRQEIDQEPSVPVFICTAAFPAVPCPLFVCEPRYRLMVRRAVESGDKTFGIVQPRSGKSRYYDVGTILDIRDCVQLGDGCSILSTIGCKRFKILARSEKDGYETAKVEYICDEPIALDQLKPLVDMHNLVLAKATGWFESLSTEKKHTVLQSIGEMPPPEPNWELISDGPAWAWWIIALLPLSQQLRVDILATTSLEKRLRAIDKMLWLCEPNQQQQQQQSSQSPQQQPHDLSLDCEEQRAAADAADAAAAAAVDVDECCLYADVDDVDVDGGERHSDEELLL